MSELESQKHEEYDSFIPFNKYHSIENIHRVIDKLSIIESETWIATEKIHGANFSATTDGKSVKYGKRSSYISGSGLEIFHHAQLIVDKYNMSIIDIFHTIFSMNNEAAKSLCYVQMFGEIFGGKYQGYKSNCKSVQKEVSYCPHIDFIVYDICCYHLRDSEFDIKDKNNNHENTNDDIQEQDKNREENDVDDDDDVVTEDMDMVNNSKSQSKYRKIYLSMHQVISLCQQVNIPVCSILYTDTLNNLLNLNPCFITTIPSSLFSLPPLENNFAEGYVLKLQTETYHHEINRPIVKLKNRKFCEHISVASRRCRPVSTMHTIPHEDGPVILDSKESGNTNNDCSLQNINSSFNGEDINDELKLLEEMKQYVNMNRLTSVLSKLDDIEKQNVKRIVGLLVKDAFNDIQKDYPGVISHENRSYFTAELRMYAAIMVSHM
jgi:Rnl2 family RNA ligase